MARKRLGELLVSAGAIDELQLHAALGEQRKWGRQLGATLVSMGLLDEKTLIEVLSAQLNLPSVNLQTVKPSSDSLKLLKAEFCFQYTCFPFGYEVKGPFLDVAMADPTNPELFDLIRVQTRCNIRPHLAGTAAIEGAIRRHYFGQFSPDEAIVDNRPWYARPDEQVWPAEAESKHPSTLVASTEPANVKSAATAPSPERQPQPPIVMPSATNLEDLHRQLNQQQNELKELRALLNRDEKVLKKLMSLLVSKGLCTRDELMAKIYED